MEEKKKELRALKSSGTEKRHFDAGVKKERKDVAAIIAKGKKKHGLADAAAAKRPLKRLKPEMSESVRLWNQFRAKTLDASTRRAAIEAALGTLSGNLYEASLKHDGARVVQAMIRYGNEEQRAKLREELVPRLAELAKLPYARHVVSCLARYCCDPMSFHNALRGKFAKLATHAVSCRAVDAVCKHMAASSKRGRQLKSKLIAEIYGTPFDSLSSAIAAEPERAKRLFQAGMIAAQRFVDKSLAHFLLAHDVFHEVCACATPAVVRELAAYVADVAAHVASSKPGALALCAMVSYADAKSRKKMVKALPKEAIPVAAADHKFAYLFLWRACDVLDDTVFVDKQLLAQVCSSLDACASPRGGKFCLWLLGADTPLNGLESQALSPPPDQLQIEATGPASKKSSDLRRRELAGFAAPRLLDLCRSNAKACLEHRPAAAVAARLLQMAEAPDLATALANASGAPSTDILDDDIAHASLKLCLQREAKSKHAALGLAIFELLRSSLAIWAESNRGAFILDALLAYDAPFAAEAARLLSANQAAMLRITQSKSKGAQALRNRLGGIRA